jgi:sporulation protein YlmC with PRC-barrel domain
MKKYSIILSMLVVFAMVLAACGPTDEPQEPFPGETMPGETTPGDDLQTQPVETPTADAALAETPAAEDTQAHTATPSDTETIEATPTPTLDQAVTPQAGETQVVPVTGQSDPAHLSTLLTYEVVNSNGEVVGMVSDAVINMCEAHVLYVVVDLDDTLAGDESGLVLIPYEAFTLDGEVQVEGNQLILSAEISDISSAPSVDITTLDLSTNEWEAEVVTFWSDYATMTFTTECPVPPAEFGGQAQATPSAGEATTMPEATPQATPTGETEQGSDEIIVVRVALATEVLSAQLVDGNGQPVGTLEEALLIPETGLLRYLVVVPDGETEGVFVLVPMGAVNVEREGTDTMVLVLLVETEIFQNAPSVATIPGMDELLNEGESFEYWSQHVEMTREEQ